MKKFNLFRAGTYVRLIVSDKEYPYTFESGLSIRPPLNKLIGPNRCGLRSGKYEIDIELIFTIRHPLENK